MKIDIWSDFVCPFCYIGKKSLEVALANFEHSDKVEVTLRSFQLDPTMPKEATSSTYDTLSKKYNLSHEKVIEMTQKIVDSAKNVGLDFHFEKGIQVNTFDAHRLAHCAKKAGKSNEMSEQLFKAHFTDGSNIADFATLEELAVEVGLDKTEVQSVLSDNGAFAESVLYDQVEAQKIGISSVPFFVLNEQYAITGAQSSDAILNIIQQVWEQENQTLQMLNGEEGQGSSNGACMDGSCSV